MATRKNNRRTQSPVPTDDEIADFEPAFDDATMYQIENAAAVPIRGQARRMALAALTRSADQLSELSMNEPAAYGEMREAVDGYATHLNGLLTAVTAASLRLNIADCREATHV